MDNAAPYRLIITASCTLVAGWGLGFIMGGPSELDHVASANAAAASNGESASSGGRREIVQAYSQTGDSPSAFASDSPLGSSVSVAAQFETLVRGALRLTDDTDRVVRLREIARALGANEIQGAVEKAKRLPYSERWQVMQTLGSRWAEISPATAAEAAVKAGNDGSGWNQLLSGVVDKWVATDLTSAMTWLKTQPDARRMQLMQTVIQSVARRDPEAALKILQTQPESNQMTWMSHQVFEQWVQRDPADAAKNAEGMKPGISRDRALQSVAANWAAQDPASAMRWAESFSDKANQNRLLRSISQAWATQDPKAAIEWAGKLSETGLRQDALSFAIGQIASTDPSAAEAQLRLIPAGQEREVLISRLAGNYSQEPKTALRFVELLPQGPQRVSTTINILSRMAGSDPKAAAEVFQTLPTEQVASQLSQFAGSLAMGNLDFAKEWVDQLSDPNLKMQAIRSIASTAARSEPKSAAEWLMQKQPSADLTWILNGWVRNAPDDAMSWAKDLPEGDAKRSVQANIVQQLASSDLERARKVFSSELSPEAQVSSASTLAGQWANRDVNAARAWAESLPDGGARDNALGSIARSWAQRDMNAAAQWLGRFEAGDSRDRIVTQFASAAAQKDPATAVAWAATIADPDLRGAQLEQLAGRWMSSDPAAARTWINDPNNLTQSARRRVLESRGPNANFQPSYYYDQDNYYYY